MDPNAFLSSADVSFVVKNNSSMKRAIKVFNTKIAPGSTLDLMLIPGVTEEDIRSELTKSYFKALFIGGTLVVVSSTINFITSDSDHATFLSSIGLPGFLNNGGISSPSAASTQILYVNKGGSDSTGDGRQINPYKTISHAMSTITDSSINKRYVIDVGPGEYSESWGIKPWVGVKGANGASNGATPNGAMLTEITALTDTIGFDSSWTAAVGFAVSFFTFLGFPNHQTWDQAVNTGMQPQLNYENCSFNNGASWLGPGNLGFDNVSLQHCITYGGFTVTGWQFLWVKGCTLLGGTVNVNAGGVGATVSTTLLAQGSSIGADYSPTDVVLHWASPSSGSIFAEADLSNSTIVGDLTLDGANTKFDSFVGASSGTVTLLNGAGANFRGTTLGIHIESHGPVPSVLAGRASGAGAGANISSDSDDNSGVVTLNTGTGAGTGDMFDFTYAIPWAGEHVPHITFSRMDANTVGQFYISSADRNGFTISASAAPTSSATYIFSYIALA